jgi:hypothetical protein
MKKPLIKLLAIKFIAGMGILALFPMGAGAQWVQTNGPTIGGAVQALVVNGNNIFAGTASGGVFRSTDSGTNWTQINSGLTNTTVNALAMSGSNIFAGTNGGGVFLSTDTGSNWTAVNSGLSSLAIWSLYVKGTYIFAGMSNNYTDYPPWSSCPDFVSRSVYRSMDNGTSWNLATCNFPFSCIGMGSIATTAGSSGVKSWATMDDYLFTGTYDGNIYY